MMVNLKPDDIPADFPVRPLRPGDVAQDRATDNACGLSWDDAVGTTWTPAPSGRCPFEYFHKDHEEEEEPEAAESGQIDAVILMTRDRRILGVRAFRAGQDQSELLDIGMDDARHPARVELWKVGEWCTEGEGFINAAERTVGSPSHWYQAPR